MSEASAAARSIGMHASVENATLEIRPVLLYSDMQSVVDFSVIPKCMTLIDLDWLFRVKYCFAPVLMAETVRLRKIIA